MIGTACTLKDFSFYDKLLAYTIAPFAVTIPLLLPAVVLIGLCRIWQWRLEKLAVRAGDGGADQRTCCCISKDFAVKWHRRLKDVLTASPLFFFFLVYPSVSQIVLEALRCDDLGPDGKFLATDYRVDCNADKHDTYTKVAYGAIAAWPVLFPVACLGLICYYDAPGLAAKKMRRAENDAFARYCIRLLMTRSEDDREAAATIANDCAST